MRSERLRWTIPVALGMLLVLGLVGCNSSSLSTMPEPGASKEGAKLSGSIQIAGSTSVQPLSEELAQVFMAKNPGVTINVAGGGSGAGITAAQSGMADIGTSSRELKNEEKGSVVEHRIALDGIAVVVHPDNPVTELTVDQIKDIFTGEIANWQDVGGKDAPITIFRREDGSGTLGAFVELTLGKDAAITDKALQQNSNGAMRTAIAGEPNAIGFVSFGYLNETIKAIIVDGIEATDDNIKAGSYKLARPFLYLTQKEPEGLVKAFIDFVLSFEGQKIVVEGYIPVH